MVISSQEEQDPAYRATLLFHRIGRGIDTLILAIENALPK
jgi:hypothetical protein